MNRKDFHTQLAIKVFDLGNKRATHRRITPKPGHHWNDKGVDEVLDHIAEDLEKRFPAEEFRVVQVGPGAYNFIHAGKHELDLGAGTLEVDGVPVGRVDSAKITLDRGKIQELAEAIERQFIHGNPTQEGEPVGLLKSFEGES